MFVYYFFQLDFKCMPQITVIELEKKNKSTEEECHEMWLKASQTPSKCGLWDVCFQTSVLGPTMNNINCYLWCVFALKVLNIETNAVRGPEIWTPWWTGSVGWFFSPPADSLLPVIVMQMLMDSEVLWLAWCGLISPPLQSPESPECLFTVPY